MRRSLPLLAAGLFALSGISVAQDYPSGTFAIVDAQVFDGENVLDRATVVVRDGLIEGVGTDLRIPDEMARIDGAGSTLLPGLIDAHVHAFALAPLEQALALGVTTVLDMFSSVQFAEMVRSRQARGELLDAADMLSARTLVTAAGGHGTQYGLPIPTLDDPAEAASFIAQRIADGSDFIKIVHEDGSGFGRVIPTLAAETITAAVTAAHQHDRLAVTHVSTLEGAEFATTARSDGLVHVFADEPVRGDLLRRMAEQDMFVVATLAVQGSMSGTSLGTELAASPLLAPYLAPDDRQTLAQTFPGADGRAELLRAAQNNVRTLHEGGVRIIAGTDAPNPGTAFGASMHGELMLLVEAGLSPAEALTAATASAADAFRLNDRGRVRPGMRADLLLVGGNPLDDITATQDIRAVWKAGVPAPRDEVRARVEQAATQPATISHTIPEDGLISNFDDGTTDSSFGAGWVESTDGIMGGQSTVMLNVIPDGADRTPGALRLTGQVHEGLPFGWSGVMFVPGGAPMRPVDLSAWEGIQLQIRGDEREFGIMLFSTATGQMPVSQSVQVTSDWTEVFLPFTSFEGIDPAAISGVVIAAGSPPGDFELWIDEVRLIRR